MSYNDGWRVYGDTPIHVEKRNILTGAKASIEKQIEKQQGNVNRVSETARKLTMNDSKARRVKANMKLQEECEYRDKLLRRKEIVEEWIKEVEKGE